MSSFKLLSAIEQVAAHLRSEVAAGRWSETMPGVYQLVEQLKVSRVTVDAALRKLEKEGLLIPQGAGRPRLIGRSKKPAAPTLRVQILLYEDSDRQTDYFLDLLHQLHGTGIIAAFASKTLLDLGMEVKRVSGFVRKTDADAWIVVAGSGEVLRWFAGQSKPAFAWFGRIASDSLALPSTAPRKGPALATAVARLVGLGHRRIVMLAREERRKPSPGFLERLFLDELEGHGIVTSSYNLPDWVNNKEGFHRRLDSLFMVSQPTALIISGAIHFWAALQHLAGRGIIAPRDISLICFDPDPTFAWSQPAVSHLHWKHKPMLRQIVRWADHVRRGKAYRLKSSIEAEFFEGGTIGPAPRIVV